MQQNANVQSASTDPMAWTVYVQAVEQLLGGTLREMGVQRRVVASCFVADLEPVETVVFILGVSRWTLLVLDQPANPDEVDEILESIARKVRAVA